MKKLILIIAIITFGNNVMAQIDYYANHETVAGTNVVYRVYSFPGTYRISNIANTRDNEPMRLLNGSLAPPPFELYDVKYIGDPKGAAVGMLREVFTQSEITALKNKKLHIFLTYIIEPNGNIAEVRFQITNDPLLYSIPPDKWYSLEQKIKQRVKYEVSPKGKTVQFIVCSTIWDFAGLFK